MKKKDDRHWSAYIDGALSVSEVEEFEALLSPDELQHLNNERSLEQVIANFYKDGPACPEHLLNDVQKTINQEKVKRPLVLVYLLAGAIAACLVLLFTFPGNEGGGTKLPPLSLDSLKRQSATSASLEDVNQYLGSKNISLELRAFTDGHHSKEIIGAGVEQIAGEEVVVLLFSCCGEPAKVYLLPTNSKAEELMVYDSADWKNIIQSTAKKGTYRLALTSLHSSESILSFIKTKA